MAEVPKGPLYQGPNSTGGSSNNGSNVDGGGVTGGGGTYGNGSVGNTGLGNGLDAGNGNGLQTGIGNNTPGFSNDAPLGGNTLPPDVGIGSGGACQTYDSVQAKWVTKTCPAGFFLDYGDCTCKQIVFDQNPSPFIPGIDNSSSCPRLTDYGIIYGYYGNGSSGKNDIPNTVSKFLATTSGYKIAQMSLVLKNELSRLLSISDSQNNYSWQCIGSTIYQYICAPGVEVSYTLFPNSAVTVAKFYIPQLGGTYYATDSGGLCKLITTPKTPGTPPPGTPIPDVPPKYDVPNTPATPDTPIPRVPNAPPGTEVGVGKIFTYIDNSDMMYQKEKVVRGIWSGNIGNLTAFYTCSTQYTGSGRSHYIIYNKPCENICSAPQFDIAYGHDQGSGSVDLNTSKDFYSPSNAIYGQYRLLCLEASQSKFNIGGNETDSIYVLNVRQERMRDRLDEGNFEINIAHLSGSEYLAGGGTLSSHTGSNVRLAGNNKILRLIDDSIIAQPTVTVAGDTYNLVSGSIEDGVYNSTAPHIYGTAYPSLGIVILDANKLDISASFGTVTSVQTDGDNAFKLFTAISGAALTTDASGDYNGFKARNIEWEYNNYYFVRVNHSDYNHTNNPTYQTGSEGDIIPEMLYNPNVYITTVGLYNSRNELLAVGKVSQPLHKTPSEEALFKVKLKVG